jgi:hypothetical protein
MAPVNEHVVEVRYKANPKVLDYRGTWAEGISEHMGLKKWRINDNRVDVHNEDASVHAFVGFGNAGFSTFGVDTRDFFPNKAIRFFKYLFGLDGFGKQIHVKRFGVRSRFAHPFKGDFDDLVHRYATGYLSLTPEAKDAMGGKLVDIGAPLNFTDKIGNFNTMSGPMRSDQLENYFGKQGELPKVSLYFDVDYWVAPDKDMDEREVTSKIKQMADEGWDKSDRIRRLVVGV